MKKTTATAAVVPIATRPAIFISHATPEDSRFTIWLGAKLTALGYEVWSDVMRLRGGDDWQRKLESALRERAGKVLLVGTRAGVEKQGVRNEIQIATTVSKAIGDPSFIIPLRLEPYDAPFLIVQAQYIDFARGWAKGFAELLIALDEARIPRSESNRADSLWRDVQLSDGNAVVDKPESLISNWLRIKKLPTSMKLYAIDGKPDASRIRDAPWPIVPFGPGVLSFASLADLEQSFSPLPVRLVEVHATLSILESGWAKHGLLAFDARRHFSDLARQALNLAFAQRGLSAFELGSRRLAWWPTLKAAPTGKVKFRWGGLSGLRQIQGVSGKGRLHWHYGVSASVRTSPVHLIALSAHVIFTTDGQTPLGDAARMHRARRSATKAWRNARWRDMLLAFLAWFANGESFVVFPVGSDDAIWVELPPMQFSSPVSVPADVTDEDNDIVDDAPADELILDGHREEDEIEINDDD